MEIPEIILSQALQSSNSASIYEGLSVILKKLEDKTPIDFFDFEKRKEIRDIDIEIRELINKDIYLNKGDENQKIEVVAQIISTIKNYLQKGISNADVRSILIFLCVNCCLQVEIENLLSEEELDESNTIEVSEKIVKNLTRLKMSTKLFPNAPYHEKEMMDESLEGFANSDIAKTYQMIEAIERGGQGFHFNFLLEHLLSFLFHINFNYFIKALSLIENPTVFVFYLQSFKKEELIKIANEPSLSNKWLNFEIIRQIVEKEKKESFDESETNAIKAIVERIQSIDFAFLKQTIKYFNRSRLFNASLGVLLASNSNIQIEEIISECFTVDKYAFNLEARDSLREHFIKFATEEQYDFMHTLVFNKWKHYFDNILKMEDFYQNELLLTDFGNFVVHYHTKLTDDNDLNSMMQSLIENIKFIDSEWAISSLHQMTKFHLYHSELLLLTFAYRNKVVNEPTLLANYIEIINNPIQVSRYVSDQTENYFKQAKQNIDWTTK